MRKLSDPKVYFAKGGHKKDPGGGWTGFVVIEESHISIHTFPKRGFVSIDVYTCQEDDMDNEYVVNYFVEKFELKDIETNLIFRGNRYPSRDIY